MATNQQSKIVELYVQCFTLNTYTIYENKLMLRILKYCQPDIHAAITQQSQGGKQLVFSREENSEQMRHVKIPISELEPSRTHHTRVRVSLASMATKAISIPFKPSPKQRSYKTFPQLFTVTFVREGKRDFAILHAKLEVLRSYLSIDMGYHTFDVDKCLSFNHFSTRQMYRFYYAYFAKGYLKMNPQFMVHALSANGNYPTYSSVAQKLLAPACEELEKAYQNRQCDIHFTFKPVYADETRHSIWADTVYFTFMERQDEELSQEKKVQLDTFQHQVHLRLVIGWGVESKVAYNLCSQIEYQMRSDIELLLTHKEWYRKKKEREGIPLANPAGYIRRAFEKYFAEKKGGNEDPGKKK